MDSDAAVLHAAVFGDPLAMRYIGNGSPRTLEQIEFSVRRKIRCLAEHGITMFTVIERETEAIIGDCGVIPVAWQGTEFELGYRLAASAWGKGYATEAGRAALEAAWKRTGLDQVMAVTDLRNNASQRVLAKLGFADRGETTAYYNGERLRWFTIDRPANNQP